MMKLFFGQKVKKKAMLAIFWVESDAASNHAPFLLKRWVAKEKLFWSASRSDKVR